MWLEFLMVVLALVLGWLGWALILFPAIPEALKTPDAARIWHPDDIVPRTIRQLRERWPELTICSDVALDPYSSDGHDGLLAPDGRILNVVLESLLGIRRAGADCILTYFARQAARWLRA